MQLEVLGFDMCPYVWLEAGIYSEKVNWQRCVTGDYNSIRDRIFGYDCIGESGMEW